MGEQRFLDAVFDDLSDNSAPVRGKTCVYSHHKSALSDLQHLRPLVNPVSAVLHLSDML